MSEASVIVANFMTSEEAYLARNCLLESGIEAFIVDEYMVALDFRLEPALGGVKVMVRKVDAKQAVSILNEITEQKKSPRKHEKIVLTDEEMARLAYRSAGFSIALPPLVLYSVWIICRLLLRSNELSPGIRRHLLLAATIDLCVMVITILILVSVFL